MCLEDEAREGGAAPFLAQGAQAIPMGTGVSRLPLISIIAVASGDGPRLLPSEKPGFCSPASVPSCVGLGGRSPRFASALVALDWFL